MPQRNMSQADINRRKKLQAHISQTTGTLGLTSLGAFAASKAPGSRRLVRVIPAIKRINPKKAADVALGTSTAGAGIGGAGSFNFASYSAAEARQRKRPVSKRVKKSASTSAFGITH